MLLKKIRVLVFSIHIWYLAYPTDRSYVSKIDLGQNQTFLCWSKWFWLMTKLIFHFILNIQKVFLWPKTYLDWPKYYFLTYKSRGNKSQAGSYLQIRNTYSITMYIITIMYYLPDRCIVRQWYPFYIKWSNFSFLNFRCLPRIYRL